MKLIFKEYLASLKERDDLDVILPDLLSEIGWSVFSKPAVGTRQHGVDVAAVGADDVGGKKKVFLFSIKAGDLRRSSWDSGEQSLRQSLNEIRDVYINNILPNRYRDLPVVIVICIGGDLHEDVRSNVEGYISKNERDGISFDIWNGDKLSDLLISGVLRDHALPKTWRSDFRKSVSLVDEPEASFRYFRSFVNSIADLCKPTRPSRLTAVRQIYVGLWTLFVWARGASNTESGYLSSEYAVLVGWSLVKDHLDGKSKAARQLRQSMCRLIELHGGIADDYFESYVEPRAKILHGLSAAVPSQASLDVNLRMFDLLGRLGMRGIWHCHMAERVSEVGTEDGKLSVQRRLRHIAQIITNMISNNPILNTPIKDDHAIDVNIACLFLRGVGCIQFIKDWIRRIAHATRYAFQTDGPYPCVHRDYRDLVEHPRDEAGYRERATAGSIMVPTLAMWAAIADDPDTLEMLAEFTSGPYKHSTLQLWYPGDDSEEHFYRGSADHGLAATGIKVVRSCGAMVASIAAECTASSAFRSLSAIRRGLWPLVILACRHHRMPVPPHFWGLNDAGRT